MHFNPNLKISDFDYELPNERIAKYPLPQRDQSKLLQYRNGKISHHIFKELPGLLKPSEGFKTLGGLNAQERKSPLLVFNDTKVIHARMIFRKATGARIEVFCLAPLQPHDIQQAMQQQGQCRWECMVGNLKRWKEGEIPEQEVQIDNQILRLKANRVGGGGKAVEVEFSWNPPAVHFAEILAAAGQIPLPPYLNRASEAADNETYQTIYARAEGAVAAPTAGLHFSQELLQELQEQQVAIDELTLHVSAGTFQPVSEEYVRDHPMHTEQIIISRKNIEKLIKNEVIVATGTTTLRALESLYWGALQMVQQQKLQPHFHIPKLFPYQFKQKDLPPLRQLMPQLMQMMQQEDVEQLSGETEIMIVPGYDFQVCDTLITNYHTPRSTLLLLIAAFVGDDWQRIYQEALAHNYRFLSYGDSSLLWR